ncbi:DNA replication complex GINS protein PSF1-like [Planococcus citri]|uniref:DNA replication complex GINS protein PSF1-like n=1 Tax=Planococcus citri TaxID=170843 RepID=UPI0031F8BCD5
MLCSQAIELIKELDRSSEDVLPPYNTDGVRLVLNEMKNLYDENVDTVNSTRDHIEDAMFALKIRHKALKRNRRCLLAYLWNRIDRIKEMRWQIGSILPPEIKFSLSPAEEQWFSNYCKSLASYMRSIGPDGGLNLLQDLKPPKSLFIEVRSLVDIGEIELDDGEVIILKKDAQYMLLRSQCESLIHQGILQHVHHS